MTLTSKLNGAVATQSTETQEGTPALSIDYRYVPRTWGEEQDNGVIREMKRYNLHILGLNATKAKRNDMKEVDGAK